MEVLAEEPGFSRDAHHAFATAASTGPDGGPAGAEGGAAAHDPLALVGKAIGATGGLAGGQTDAWVL